MRVTMRRVLLGLGFAVALMVTVHLGQQMLECQELLGRGYGKRTHGLMRPENEELVMVDSSHIEYRYSKEMPLIFIGGVPRSGTTLMRAMLDAHPEVRCGEETRIIPRVLAMRQAWSKSGREKMRLDEAGVTDQVLDAAMQAFILEVIAKHGEPARYLCNKDPFTLKSSVYLSRLFPNSKFLLMVRDGRASVHSMITRKVTIAGFDLNSYRDCLTKWNKAIEVMYSQCAEIGQSRCLPVYYEQLVLHPEQSMRVIMQFLDISWSDAVLHHEELIGKPGGVSLSKTSPGTAMRWCWRFIGVMPRGHSYDVHRTKGRLFPCSRRCGAISVHDTLKSQPLPLDLACLAALIVALALRTVPVPASYVNSSAKWDERLSQDPDPAGFLSSAKWSPSVFANVNMENGHCTKDPFLVRF
uniref:Protein-tyrosine sulfotransferase n=1 Tax=Chelonoidis abingdonii TaxID=106734 RepID=A0A8C0GJ72_CHEAB